MAVSGEVRSTEPRERFVELLFREAGAVGWSTDRELRITHLEGPALTSLGLAPERLVGRTVEEIAPGECAGLSSAHRLAIATGLPQALTHELRGRTFDVRIEPLRDERGAIEGCACVALDVTARRQVTEALQGSCDRLERSVSLLNATLEATSDGLLVIDRRGRVVACNQRFFRMWRLPDVACESALDEVLLAAVADQLADPDSFVRGVQALYDHPDKESFDVLCFKDGRVFERTSLPQRVGDEIVGRVWSFHDVTERERLLHRAVFLSDATRLLASLDLEHALGGVAHLAVPFFAEAVAIDLVVDGPPRRLLTVSRDPVHSAPLDLDPAVLAGRPLLQSLGGISHLAVPLVVHDEVVGAMTFRAARSRAYNPDDLALAEELARRAALSVANARLYRNAEEALRARDEFLSIASHEIRGPLTSIHLATQVLRRLPPAAVQEDLPKLLEVIEREDRRLARFVEELLDVGRIRGGRLTFEPEDTDLAEVVREVASSLGPELGRTGSLLTIRAESAVVGRWDRFRVEQVVTNLLSNAIKFGLGRPIEVLVRAEEGTAILRVEDHGIGIEPAMQQRIFSPFERAVSARHYGGLGLGLYIVHTIVDQMGGRITVESTPGAGATFTVELPLVPRPG